MRESMLNISRAENMKASALSTVLVGFLAMAAPLVCSAQIGLSEKECDRRYGVPARNADTLAVFPATKARRYTVGGFNFVVQFMKDKACAITLKREGGNDIIDSERDSVRNGNGAKWLYDDHYITGVEHWVTADGNTASFYDSSDKTFLICNTSWYFGPHVDKATNALLGLSEKECTERLGDPVAMDGMAALPATKARSYSAHGLEIFVEFVEDRACVVVLGRGNLQSISDDERDILLDANANDATWKGGDNADHGRTTRVSRSDGKAIALADWNMVTICSTDWIKQHPDADSLVQLGMEEKDYATRYGAAGTDEPRDLIFPATKCVAYTKSDFRFSVQFVGEKAAAISVKKVDGHHLSYIEQRILLLKDAHGEDWQDFDGIWDRTGEAAGDTSTKEISGFIISAADFFEKAFPPMKY